MPRTETGENDSVCRKCGQRANDMCSGCKDALYCSIECQRWDYRVGCHRALCKGPPVGRKINKVLRALFAAEWKWLNGLSAKERAELFSSHTRNYPLNHLFQSGAVALVLARVNACALLTNRHDCQDEYGAVFYSQVLEPWFVAHKEFLVEEGFDIEYIDHSVRVSGGIDAMTDHGMVAIVKDTRSPKIEMVNRVFNKIRSPISFVWTEDEAATWKDMESCLSFYPTRMGGQATGSKVRYYFQYPKQAFGGDVSVCCSPMFEHNFIVDPVDAKSLGQHFFKSYQALAKLGFPIEFVLLHQEDWPESALAEAWWAAAGRDMKTFRKWILEKDSPILCRLDRASKDRLIDAVYELQDELN